MIKNTLEDCALLREKFKLAIQTIDVITDDLNSKVCARNDFRVTNLEYNNDEIEATAYVIGSQYPFHYSIPVSWLDEDFIIKTEYVKKEIAKDIIKSNEKRIKECEKNIKRFQEDIKQIKSKIK